MNSLFDNLNLRPGERRLIVVVAIVTFVVLNFWFVWPHRNDWKTVREDLDDAQAKLADYQNTVDQLQATSARLSQVETGGSALLADTESVHLLRTIQTLTTKHQVNINRYEPQTENSLGTNNFFIERTLPIQYISTKDTNLINFLISVGSDESLIRVRDLSIKPDPSRTALVGRITLVASYRGSGETKKTGFNSTKE